MIMGKKEKPSSSITRVFIFREVVVCCLTITLALFTEKDSHVLAQRTVLALPVPWKKKYFLECNCKTCMAFLRQLRDPEL